MVGFAGLLWSKQFYYYNIRDWLDGDPNMVIKYKSIYVIL